MRLLILTAFSFYSVFCWSQTWNLSNTMKATLDKNILTIRTTLSAEAMPNFPNSYTSVWDDVRDSIYSVVIEENVTTIGNYAFFRCDYLKSISFPKSIQSIGLSAFYWCFSLESVTIPDGVATIAENAFGYCYNLTSVSIPASVTLIGIEAFGGNDNLESIQVHANNKNYLSVDGVLFDKNATSLIKYPANKSGVAYVIPNTVKTIDVSAFYNARLTSITIPNSVTEIKEKALRHCQNLETITIPNSVISLGEGAFANCIRLQSITIPGSVKEIGFGAFNACKNLTSIQVDSQNTNYSSDAGILYNKDRSLLHTFPSAKVGTAFSVPSFVTTIEKYAFFDCRLTSVTISNSVKEIRTNAFDGCESLKSVSLSNAMTEIAGSTFSHCINLETIEIPNSITSIGWYAFYACYKLQSIVLPKSLKRIDHGAFLECSGLQSLDIPDLVEFIGPFAFSGCESLASIRIPSSVSSLDIAFEGCISLKKVTVEWNVPLVVPDQLFGDVNLLGVALYVPNGTKARYQTAKLWKDFGTIVEYKVVATEQLRIDGKCPVSAWAHDGILHITGLQPDKPFQIYNLAGQYIYKGIAKGEEAQIALPTGGIYIVQTGAQSMKVVVN